MFIKSDPVQTQDPGEPEKVAQKFSNFIASKILNDNSFDFFDAEIKK